MPTTLLLDKGPMKSKVDVKLTNIESELTKLWESLEQDSKIRACLFNLVIYTDDGDRTAHFREVIDTIIERLPCRIHMIRADRNHKKGFLRTSVSAVTSGKGSQQVACDQIVIEAGGNFIERVPYIVLPHLVPDLPVYLIWGQDPSIENEVLPHLEKLASRVIFDSECSENLQLFSETVLAHARKLNCAFADLNWARFRGWRDGLAQVFHNEDRVHELADAKVIHVNYNNRDTPYCRHNEVQAFYLQGWLASRMGWQFSTHERSEGNHRIAYRHGAESTAIILQPQIVEDLPGGSILSIEIESRGDHFASISREGSSRSVRVEFSSPEKCEIPSSVLLSPLNRGQQLIKEIFYEKASEHYIGMLKIISDIPPGP